MKAFIVGTAAAILIAIASGAILNTMEMSTARTYSTSNVRL